MRLGSIVCWVAFGSAVSACGSSTSNDLFTGSTAPSCQAGPCTGDNGCPGHRKCDASGELGTCACDPPTGSGGAGAGLGGSAGAGQAAGGAEVGGSLGAGGSTLGSGGDFGTGGFLEGSGGSGSGGDSFGAGGSAGAHVDAGAACPTGTFNGSYSGPYDSPISGHTVVKGTFTLSVTGDGRVTGNWSGASLATAPIVGRMNCSTGELSAEMQNGTYRVFTTVYRFTGTLTGTFTESSGSFAGNWTITESNPPYGGSGTFTAQ